MANIKLVIFDLDGTLLDTIEDLGDSVNEVLSSRDFPEHTYDQYCLFIGDGMEKLIQRSIPRECLDDKLLVGKILNDYREAYARNWNKKSKPYQGVMNLLNQLKTRDVKSSVLSNKPHQFTELCVEELIGNKYFEMVLGQREGVKEAIPDGAIEICHSLNIDPEETLFIGDTNVDIATGIAAGMKTIESFGGFVKKKNLEKQGLITLSTGLIKFLM